MMTKIWFCWYCQTNLDAFLDSRLRPRARRRVARHIDECPSCYQAYVCRRDLRRELYQLLPLVGQRHAPDFAGTWEAVRAELPQPTYRQPQLRYGVALLLVLLALALPFTMSNRDVVRALPEQPQPHARPLTETPPGAQPAAMVTAVASATETVRLVLTPPTLPEPERGF